MERVGSVSLYAEAAMVKIGLARQCIRSIEQGRACALREGRNMAVTPQPHASCGGKSIIEMIWDELMQVYSRIMLSKQYVESGDQRAEDFHAVQDIGEAIGLATALSLLLNPYNPDIDAIREEAAQRWESMS
jgi:hypothetical protein